MLRKAFSITGAIATVGAPRATVGAPRKKIKKIDHLVGIWLLWWPGSAAFIRRTQRTVAVEPVAARGVKLWSRLMNEEFLGIAS